MVEVGGLSSASMPKQVRVKEEGEEEEGREAEEEV